MIRIKLNLFESIVVATILPNGGFILTTIALIISLIVKQDRVVYKGIMISYIVCSVLLMFSVFICILVNSKSKKEFILYEDKFKFLDREYSIDQIRFCEYYVCKWYFVPIAFIYKQQVGGLICIKLNTGEKIHFKIFYKDYLRLKNKIHNIIEK